MGAMEQFTEAMINKTLTQKYPHLKLPAVMLARVVTGRELEDTHTWAELTICSDEPNGGSYKGHIITHWWEYTLELLDRAGSVEQDSPLIPGVRSKVQIQTGAYVAVGLPHGQLTPEIIGEVRL